MALAVVHAAPRTLACAQPQIVSTMALNPIAIRRSARVRRRVPLDARDVGFEIRDRFVVGYGLDHAEQLRNVPHIAVLP